MISMIPSVADATEGSWPPTRVRPFVVSRRVGWTTFALRPRRRWPLWSRWQTRGPLSPLVNFLTLTLKWRVISIFPFITPAQREQVCAAASACQNPVAPSLKMMIFLYRFNTSTGASTDCTGHVLDYTVIPASVWNIFSVFFFQQDSEKMKRLWDAVKAQTDYTIAVSGFFTHTSLK